MISQPTEIAVFGGGCFWCTEAVFNELKGIKSAMPGYSGGTIKNPTYEAVSSGKTGHAEVTRIEFDPAEISFNDLLTVFFATHDPTTPNRQGNDVGTEYRSVIFYTNEKQREEAEKFISTLNTETASGSPVITEVKPLADFYPAEDYHQKYFATHGSEPYCQIIIAPKVLKVQKQFVNLLKSQSKN